MCDGWYEFKFTLNSEGLDPNFKDDMFIHLEFEEYEPRFLGKLNKKNKYQINVMIPNSSFWYFFSNGGNTFVNQDDPLLDIKVKELKLNILIGTKKVAINMEIVRLF